MVSLNLIGASVKNEWFHMVSPLEGGAPIQIHQDANLYSLSLEAGKEIHFPVKRRPSIVCCTN